MEWPPSGTGWRQTVQIARKCAWHFTAFSTCLLVFKQKTCSGLIAKAGFSTGCQGSLIRLPCFNNLQILGKAMLRICRFDYVIKESICCTSIVCAIMSFSLFCTRYLADCNCFRLPSFSSFHITSECIKRYCRNNFCNIRYFFRITVDLCYDLLYNTAT